jgi:hypothetical protein
LSDTKKRRFRYRSTWRGRLVLQVEVDHFEFGIGWQRVWRDATVSDLPFIPHDGAQT